MTNLTRSHFQVHPFHLVSSSPKSMYTSIALFNGKMPITRCLSNKSTVIPSWEKEFISKFSKAFLTSFFNDRFENYTDIQLLLLEITEEFFHEHINHVDFDHDLMELDYRVINASAAEIENYYYNNLPNTKSIDILLKGLDSDPQYYISEYKYLMRRIYLKK